MESETAAAPDADLLAAVTEEIGLDPEDSKDREVGALALRAAGRVLGERLRERGRSAGRIIRSPGQTPLCGPLPTHDDRWCDDCDRMDAGLNVAANIVESACGVPSKEVGA